jgi:hypothetical protein
MENAMLAEHWNSLTAWLKVTGRPWPPYSVGQAKPAASGKLFERFSKTLGRGDARIVVPGAAFEIAHSVQGLQHLFGELGRLRQNRLAHVGGGIGKTGKVVVAVDPEDVVEQELHVFHRSFVDRHFFLPAPCSCGTL